LSQVAVAANTSLGVTLATPCKPFYMRFVSITTYAKLVGITRPAVYKRIKSGKAKLLDDCEVPVIDMAHSKGNCPRNDWKDLIPKPVCPF